MEALVLETQEVLSLAKLALSSVDRIHCTNLPLLLKTREREVKMMKTSAREMAVLLLSEEMQLTTSGMQSIDQSS